MPLDAYLPQDRRRALARGAQLPEVCRGAVLFSDISGFTSLTEALTRESGQRRGVDELVRRINAVHQVLIDEIERWDGSVVAFAGDGMTCWFDGDQATPRALGCAAAMQRAMERFPELSVKIGVSAGETLRVVVGDPEIQRIDLLAGATVARAVVAQGLAGSGEVVVDTEIARSLGGDRPGTERRAASGEPFHLWVDTGNGVPPRVTAGQDSGPDIDSESLRAWVLPVVFERETASGGLFATDLRPATALFVRVALGGGPDAGARADADRGALEATVSCVQRTLWQHGGVLLEVSVDAAGTCFYGQVGAAQVHEDDAQRALRAALDLRQQLGAAGIATQMGLSSGTLCVGGYGGSRRRSFGAIGDAVNAAARLMALARPGDVLVAGRVRQPLVEDEFTFEARAPIAVKGKAEPLPVSAVTGMQRRRPIRLQEPASVLPMVGREAETARLTEAIAAARGGRGQVLRIVAEAGMGKSRLLAEGIRLARREGLIGYGGACRQGGPRTPYLVWQGVWTAFFDVDPSLPPRRQRLAAQAALLAHAPEHADAWPLLGAVLAQAWPDTPLTASLPPKDRKSLLHTMLLRCLRTAGEEAAEDGVALLIVLEDLHAADALSWELLAELARDIDALPVLVLTAERRSGSDAEATPVLANARRIELRGLEDIQVEHIVRAKLAERFPERVGPVPRELLERIAARAQGNPFYVEELLDYLHDRGLDPRRADAVLALELPSSLHSLVLSRIDALRAAQQNELKAASVIGREFGVADLHGYCPSLGSAEQVASDLGELGRLGFTPPLAEAAQASHVFRHLVTQEVAYESIAQDTRAQLHGQCALYFEQLAGDSPAPAPLLAHHFVRAERALGRKKACRYLQLAGEEAAARFAHHEALAHFEQALLWLAEEEHATRFDLLVQRQAIFDLQGRHDRQVPDLDELEQLAPKLPDAAMRRAKVALLRAELDVELGRYADAQAHALDAMALLDADAAAASRPLRLDATLQLGQVKLFSGDAVGARPLLDAALAMAREDGLVAAQAKALSTFGRLHLQLGEYAPAERRYAEALELARQGSQLRAQLNLLNNLAAVAQSRGRLSEAARRYEDALLTARRIGDRSGEAMLLTNLGGARLLGGHLYQARLHCEQAARIFAETGETVLHAKALINWAEAHRELGQLQPALELTVRALESLRACGSRPGEASALEYLGLIEAAAGHHEEGQSHLQAAVQIARETGSVACEASSLAHLGRLQTKRGELAAASRSLEQARALASTLGDEYLSLHIDAAMAMLLAARGSPNATEGLERLLAKLLGDPDPDAPALPLGLHADALRVLRGCGDPRAAALAESSRRELLARADRIPDPQVRSDFLALADHRLIFTEATDGR